MLAHCQWSHIHLRFICREQCPVCWLPRFIRPLYSWTGSEVSRLLYEDGASFDLCSSFRRPVALSAVASQWTTIAAVSVFVTSIHDNFQWRSYCLRVSVCAQSGSLGMTLIPTGGLWIWQLSCEFGKLGLWQVFTDSQQRIHQLVYDQPDLSILL